MTPCSPSLLPLVAPSQSSRLVPLHLPDLSTLRAQSPHLCSCLGSSASPMAFLVLYALLIPTGPAHPRAHSSPSTQNLVPPSPVLLLSVDGTSSYEWLKQNVCASSSTALSHRHPTTSKSRWPGPQWKPTTSHQLHHYHLVSATMAPF